MQAGSPSELEQAACASAMASRTAGAAVAQACSDWDWSSAIRACSSAAPYRLPARHCCSGFSTSAGCGCRGSCMPQEYGGQCQSATHSQAKRPQTLHPHSAEKLDMLKIYRQWWASLPCEFYARPATFAINTLAVSLSHARRNPCL